MTPSTAAHFWSGKRVLVTGHTGFKGAWLSIWLQQLGAEITGISLPPNTVPNLFTLAGIDEFSTSYFSDIRNAEEIAQHIQDARPEIVFHLAAQALVRQSYCDPPGTFQANVMGTVNVLDALRQVDSVRVVVAVTTDKVYRNHKHSYPYRETDVLGGHDPYSASKAAAEIVISSYRDAFFQKKNAAVASARSGNVIGGGDWSDSRLIPDAVRAWKDNQRLNVRKPQAVRPWQHVIEALAGYMKLAEQLWNQRAPVGAYNFGPRTDKVFSVREVISLAQLAHGSGEVSWENNTGDFVEEDWLALEIVKSREILGVQPYWSLQQAINRTMQWYRKQQQGVNARSLCEADISDYQRTDSDTVSYE
jgi:CDP-glucose 4,6-dehydratase